MPESLNQRIADAITQHAVDLERFKGGQARDIRRLLVALEQELIAAVAVHDVTAPAQVAYRQARQSALLNQTRDTIKGAYQNIAKTHQQALVGLAGLEEMFSRSLINQPITSLLPAESIQERGKPRSDIQVEVASTALSPEQLKAIASDVSIDGAHVNDWWKRQEESLRFSFQRQIQLGMMQGEGVEQITKRIRGTKENRFKD